MNETYDLGAIIVLLFKEEMIQKGIIPQNVKWEELTEKQRQDVIDFITLKINEKKEELKC